MAPGERETEQSGLGGECRRWRVVVVVVVVAVLFDTKELPIWDVRVRLVRARA